jgi:hypothetical protein
MARGEREGQGRLILSSIPALSAEWSGVERPEGHPGRSGRGASYCLFGFCGARSVAFGLPSLSLSRAGDFIVGDVEGGLADGDRSARALRS